MPGGVNSPVRAFGGVGGIPVFFAKGEGAYLYDVEGRRYADYVCSWGAAIAGHARPEIVEAVRRAAGCGLGFGARAKLNAVLPRFCAMRCRPCKCCALLIPAPKRQWARFGRRAVFAGAIYWLNLTAVTTDIPIRFWLPPVLGR